MNVPSPALTLSFSDTLSCVSTVFASSMDAIALLSLVVVVLSWISAACVAVIVKNSMSSSDSIKIFLLFLRFFMMEMVIVSMFYDETC